VCTPHNGAHGYFAITICILNLAASYGIHANIISLIVVSRVRSGADPALAVRAHGATRARLKIMVHPPNLRKSAMLRFAQVVQKYGEEFWTSSNNSRRIQFCSSVLRRRQSTSDRLQTCCHRLPPQEWSDAVRVFNIQTSIIHTAQLPPLYEKLQAAYGESS
jgi:hypothetical protein